MKKLLFLLAIAGLTSFAACKSGGTKVEATVNQDSIAQVQQTRSADSAAAAQKAAAEVAHADSVAKGLIK